MKERSHSNVSFATTPFLSKIYSLKTHILQFIKKKKPYKRKFCNFTCSKRSDLKSNNSSIHERNKPFKCRLFNHTFSQKSSLKQHTTSIHEGRKPFNCGFCDYTLHSYEINSSIINDDLKVNFVTKMIAVLHLNL